MFQKRSSGILMHLSSLPGPFGIGDLGPPAHNFIDFLEHAAQNFWQFLPTVPSDGIHAGSPYVGLSSIAGNPLFISPDTLLAEQLLTFDELRDLPPFSEYRVDYHQAAEVKKRLLCIAFGRFKDLGMSEEFSHFCAGEFSWLDDYALFMALKKSHHNQSWHQWPSPLASRDRLALEEARSELAAVIEYYQFEQFCFHKQWHALRDYAARKQVFLIGDLPIYVSFDSVDVWANQSCFRLHQKERTPTHVAGVPPDYFSDTGQRWGNPLYRWQVNNKKNDAVYSWWRNRFKQMAKMVDVVRIDHFRGFESYWEIPATEKTAVNGRWRQGPGKQFFMEMEEVNRNLAIIAEDLGIITPAVGKLRDELGFPGMKILQFAFDSDSGNLYLPHNYGTSRCVVYTGTHDNNTTLGWYKGDDSPKAGKERARRYANSRDDGLIHWDFLRMAFSSVATLAIIPMQDILGFGADCRMNTPGTVEGNWGWRCAPRFFTDEVAGRLRDETIFYGRDRGGIGTADPG